MVAVGGSRLLAEIYDLSVSELARSYPRGIDTVLRRGTPEFDARQRFGFPSMAQCFECRAELPGSFADDPRRPDP